MTKCKRIFLMEMTRELMEKDANRVIWKGLKDYYQSLKDDKEKEKFLSVIFKDKDEKKKED